MDFTTISYSPSSSFLDHLKTIVNASPGIGRAAAFFGVENIIIWEIPGFVNLSHQELGLVRIRQPCLANMARLKACKS